MALNTNRIDMSSRARLESEIRAAAEALRANTPHDKLPAHFPRPLRKHEDVRQRLDYSIPELCRFPFTTFVDHAFRAVLKRPPDSVGFDKHVRLLLSGGSKIEVLGDLRYSPEGRAVGVRIPRLLPQYMLTKLFRMPVLGYALEWLATLARLPGLVRQLRAVDTIHYSRSYEIDAEVRRLVSGLEAIDLAHGATKRELGSARAEIQASLAGLAEGVRAELDAMADQVGRPQHLVLAMNHWLAELRRNLASLEAEEDRQRGRTDALAMALLDREAHASSSSRLRAVLAERVARGGRVLDLGSGPEWIASLQRDGFEVAGVDANAAVVARGRDAGLAIEERTVPGAFAGRPDGSVDAVTALSFTALLPAGHAGDVLFSARRVLKPGGVVIVAFERSVADITAQLSGRAVPRQGMAFVSNLLEAAGFAGVEHGEDDAYVLARNPA